MLTNDEAIEKFCDEYQRMRGVDPDMIYGLHLGDDDRECALTVSSLRSLVGELRAERTRTETQDGQITTILLLASLADLSCERDVLGWCGACPSCDLARYLTKLNDARVAAAVVDSGGD